MMEKIIKVKSLNDFKVWIQFRDGFSAEVDIKPFFKGGISDSLNDPEIFKSVRVDDFNGISWKNGYDFCPNFLREYINSLPIYKTGESQITNFVADK